MEAPHRPAGPIAQRRQSRSSEWYAMRWKIEMFHKILKIRLQGLIKSPRLRTAETIGEPHLAVLAF